MMTVTAWAAQAQPGSPSQRIAELAYLWRVGEVAVHCKLRSADWKDRLHDRIASDLAPINYPDGKPDPNISAIESAAMGLALRWVLVEFSTGGPAICQAIQRAEQLKQADDFIVRR